MKALLNCRTLLVLVLWKLQTVRLGLLIVIIRVLRCVNLPSSVTRVGLALRHLLMQTACSRCMVCGVRRCMRLAVCVTSLVQLIAVVSLRTLRHLVHILVVFWASGLLATILVGDVLWVRVLLTKVCTRLASFWSWWVRLNRVGKRREACRTLCRMALRLGVFRSWTRGLRVRTRCRVSVRKAAVIGIGLLLAARWPCNLWVVSCLHASSRTDVGGRLFWACCWMVLMTIAAPFALGLVRMCRPLRLRLTIVSRVVLGMNGMVCVAGCCSWTWRVTLLVYYMGVIGTFLCCTVVAIAAGWLVHSILRKGD